MDGTNAPRIADIEPVDNEPSHGRMQSIGVVLAGFEAVSIPLLICDRAGHLIACSKDADHLLRDGALVHLNGQALRAVCRACDEDLSHAMRKATDLVAPSLSTTLLRARDWSEVARAEVGPLPALDPACRGLAGIAVIRRTHTDARQILMRLGLTAAEVDVCACLVGGATLSAIATSRDVSAETVRSQAKAIYSKLGVRGQSELAARFLGML